MVTLTCQIGRAKPILAIFLLVPFFSLLANQSTVDRPNDAVILRGDNFSEFTGVAIDDLFLFAYDSEAQTWEMIPFQIDEKDTSNNFLFNDAVDTVPGFDPNDELVFMASDLGGQANVWIDDPDSRNFPRQEIEIVDSLDPNNITMGWVYLYRSSTLSPTFSEDYVTYTPSADSETGEDFIEGQTYKIGGNEKGFFGFLSFPGNPTVDLLDRQKIRGRTDFALVQTFDEETGFEFRGVDAIDGPVRVLRRLRISLFGLLEAPLPLQYYKSSAFLSGNLEIPEEISFAGFTLRITEIRHSIDLSPAASGMTFSNPNNSNIPVNGADDTVNDAIEDSPEVNYTHVTGSQGSIITLFQLPGSIGDQRRLFYLDRTGIGDPGDGDAYGDSGVLITGSDIEGEFPIALRLILMGPNQPSSLADLFARQEEAPLVTQVRSQEASTVSVATPEAGQLPATFALGQNFPNPFNPSTEIRYEIPASGVSSRVNRTTLTIFNLRGERVRVLVDEEKGPGFHTAIWDGRDENGQRVASGLYVYQLRVAGFAASQKMILMK